MKKIAIVGATGNVGRIVTKKLKDKAELSLLASKDYPKLNVKKLTKESMKGLSQYVTAGLKTIAIRIPNHPLTLSLLKQCNLPIAAPSANISTMLSPTKKEHIIFDIPILDGGPCQIGIESTIVEGTTILRSGIVTKNMLEKILQKPFSMNKNETTIKAPGMLKKHYCPKTPVVLNSIEYDASSEALLGFGPGNCTLNLSEKGDLKEAVQNLFAYLYELDQKKYYRIHIAPLPYEDELGDSIYDKLKRMVS